MRKPCVCLIIWATRFITKERHRALVCGLKMSKLVNTLIFIGLTRGSIMKEWMLDAIYKHLKSNKLI